MNAGEAKKQFSYDPLTGVLIRLSNGKRMKTLNTTGYFCVKANKKKWLVHRVAWLIFYGEWPPGNLDHANGDPLDNRIANLRLATLSQNMANTKERRSRSGFRGVRLLLNGTFEARIGIDGKKKHLGSFNTAEAAHDAYRRAAIEVFGEFSALSRKAG